MSSLTCKLSMSESRDKVPGRPTVNSVREGHADGDGLLTKQGGMLVLY